MDDIGNIDAVKELIERYESITLDEIKEASEYYEDQHTFEYGLHVAENLTGFGDTTKCSLCVAVKLKCKLCIYGFRYDYRWACTWHYTYANIERAKDAKSLLKAFKERAIYIRKLLKKIEDE